MSDTDTIVCATLECMSLLSFYGADTLKVSAFLKEKYPELSPDDIERIFVNAAKSQFYKVQE